MRIACVYLPSFPLQVHVRRAPHLGGVALAVASETDHPVVIACSRAAWNDGVRAGMTAVRARQICSGLVVRSASGRLYRQAAAAVADSLMALSSTVDRGHEADNVGQNRAFYLHVPTGTRGASFGNRILARLARQGFRGRVGIADDRFSAWVAAATARSGRLQDSAQAAPFAQTTSCVPRGGSATFLAPLALGLLPLDPDVLSMLRSLGVTTLGDFAKLPPPSMGRRWNERGVDLRALAGGDDPTELQVGVASGPVVEELELEQPVSGAEPLGFLLRPLLDRVCDRLRGRGGAADRIALRLLPACPERTDDLQDLHNSDDSDDLYDLDDFHEEPVILPLSQPSVSGPELAALAQAELGKRRPESPLLAKIGSIELSVLREVDLEAAGLAEDDSERGQLSLSPLMRPMRPSREAHRRTMRGQRGKKNRSRQRTSERTRGLFE